MLLLQTFDMFMVCIRVVAMKNFIEIYTTETEIRGFHGGKNLDFCDESVLLCRSLSVLS